MPLPDVLFNLLDQLPPATSDATNAFEAIPLPQHEGAYAARNAQNRPVLLVEVQGSAADTRLRSVSAIHGIRATLQLGEKVWGPLRLTQITCENEDIDLHRLFLTSTTNALPRRAAGRTATVVNRILGQLEALFAAFGRPGRPPSGLWAELLVIARSSNPRRLAMGWHVEEEDTFDFAEGDERLEVKSFSRPPRWHNFSLDQLSPPPNIRATVASIRVEPRTTGTTLGDLRQAVLDAAGDDAGLRGKIDRLCVEYLGDSWASSMQLAFDEPAALSSIRLHESLQIPRIPGPPPPGVASVRFRSNVDLSPTLAPEKLSDRPLAAAISRSG
jgi:hypothetical protein